MTYIAGTALEAIEIAGLSGVCWIALGQTSVYGKTGVMVSKFWVSFGLNGNTIGVQGCT